MPVPEAAMDENYLLPGLENKIGLARQVPAMQSVAVAEGVNESAHRELGLSVFSPDVTHNLAAFFWSQRIGGFRILCSHTTIIRDGRYSFARICGNVIPWC